MVPTGSSMIFQASLPAIFLSSTSAMSQSRVMAGHSILTCEQLALESSHGSAMNTSLQPPIKACFNKNAQGSRDLNRHHIECPSSRGWEKGALLSLVLLCVTSEIQEQLLPPVSFCTVLTAFPTSSPPSQPSKFRKPHLRRPR